MVWVEPGTMFEPAGNDVNKRLQKIIAQMMRIFIP
jgi:hypothetical protein